MFHGYTPKVSDHCGHFFMTEATTKLTFPIFHDYTPKMSDNGGFFVLSKDTYPFKGMAILQNKLN